MSAAYIPHRHPFWMRLFLAIPVIGWVARDLLFGDKDNIWFALVAFVSLWMSAVLVFGLPGLYLPALALVPIMFVLLVLYSWG
ncbi:hypothetical protein [Aestuariivita sp.]|uniref:hypothetical protein n=1 Tax=Aestuariivita sp. TaxID=1872407 RepID=UPI0021748EEB|nr:hypothetical protein [Aestuariivita sp.]MCE8006822.1 hypothetical protein [Aestuariivita sp.]